MVVPDFELICEIMLVAEGFIEARVLAKKFITLYQLCRELLSKQVSPLLWLGGTAKPVDLQNQQQHGTLPLTSVAKASQLLFNDCICASCWQKRRFVIIRAMKFSNCFIGGSAGTKALDQLR